MKKPRPRVKEPVQAHTLERRASCCHFSPLYRHVNTPPTGVGAPRPAYLQKAGLGFEPSPVQVASCVTCARVWIGLPCAGMETICTVWTFPRAGDRAEPFWPLTPNYSWRIGTPSISGPSQQMTDGKAMPNGRRVMSTLFGEPGPASGSLAGFRSLGHRRPSSPPAPMAGGPAFSD